MSIRHPEFTELVDRLWGGEQLTADDRELLEAYAEPDGIVIEDQLGQDTRETVEVLTGRDDVWSPERAARALLAELKVAEYRTTADGAEAER
jgi:hypothetical protein